MLPSVLRFIDHAAGQQVMISFRGTEGLDAMDVWSDMSLFAKTSSDGLPNIWGLVFPGNWFDLRTHPGFQKAYDSTRNRVHQLLEMCTGGARDWTVYVTGHSLGAAIATLCAYDLAKTTCAPQPRLFRRLVSCRCIVRTARA
jgi:predicted lipase